MVLVCSLIFGLLARLISQHLAHDMEYLSAFSITIDKMEMYTFEIFVESYKRRVLRYCGHGWE